MTKKKRNARERRALVGALCTAAVIVAGSTFAWFTSSDEVTNRLSASADYNVSIVESFTPPANWIPGQNINKDVYAINTGNIPAFVNEDVSGVLTYTVEQKVSDPQGCVKLTADEVDVMKAGAYLAGAFNQNSGAALNVTAGNIAEYFNNGAGTDPKTTDDFTPPVEGLYFFRRSINVNSNDQTETFTYQGYYFNGTDYYKLADIRINEIPLGKANDGITADGNLTICPTVLYAKEETKTVTPTLRYETAVTEGDNKHPQRLVATYNTAGTTAATATQATAIDNADKAITEVDGYLQKLNEAKTAYETAKSTYETAAGAYNTALATIEYYAGADNAKTIETVNFTYVDNDTTVGSAGSLDMGSIVSPGVLYQQITDYNALVSQFNALQTPISTAQSEKMLADSDVTTAESTKTTAEDAFNTAKDNYNSVFGQNYDADIAAISTPLTPEQASTYPELYTVWQKKQALDAAEADLAAKTAVATDKANKLSDLEAQRETLRNQLIALGNTISGNVTILNTAISTRNTQAAGASDGDGSDYGTAKTAYETALANYNNGLLAYNNARAAYEATDSAGGDIVIYINLSDDVVTSATVKDKWQILTTPSGNDTTAHFYYTGILQASESSAKLIDSVELSKDVKQNAYKNFDFDLNVHLDSAQITYADDQQTITAAAANEKGTAPNVSAFEDRQAALATPTDIETVVSWS